MSDLLSLLPTLPVSSEAALILSVLLISIAFALATLILSRGSASDETAPESDMGVIFENPSAIIPHVIELRQRLIYSLMAIGIGTVLSFALTDAVLTVMATPIGGLENLQVIRVTEPVGVWFRVALTVGIILASPYVIAQIWVFIVTGLRSGERRAIYLLFPFALILFLTGVSFAYFVMLPVAVPFLTDFLGLNAKPTLEDYIGFVTNVLLWVGISFEMPLVMFALAKVGVVNSGMLSRNWRVAVVLIAILAAVITPTPDPVNMGIVAAPLLILYGLSIILTRFA